MAIAIATHNHLTIECLVRSFVRLLHEYRNETY